MFGELVKLKFREFSISEEKENLFSFSSGWKNIRTIYSSNKQNEPVRIDIRLAFSDVTRENLIDFIDYKCLLSEDCHTISEYHIVYIGHFTSQVPDDEVGGEFIIDKKCKSVSHYYISLEKDNYLSEIIKVNYPEEYNLLRPIVIADVLKPANKENIRFGLRTKGIEKRDLPHKPLISIIIPSFNSEKIIEQALQSSIVQTYENKEIIIVDGGSKDLTATVVKKYEDSIDLFISEPDKNIFDAINKGTWLSNGKYSVFIGSDDLLIYNSLEKVGEKVLQYGEKDFFFGNGLTLTTSGFIKRAVCFIRGKNFSEFRISHPALYLKKDCFTELNGFNIDYYITADFDFELKLITKGKEYEKVEDFLCIFRGGGHSSRFLWKKIKQVDSILKVYDSFNFPYYLFLIRLILIVGIKRIVGDGLFNKMLVFKNSSIKK